MQQKVSSSFLDFREENWHQTHQSSIHRSTSWSCERCKT